MDFHPYTAQTTKSWLLSSFDCYHSSFLSTISYNLLSYKFGIYFYHISIKYLGNPHSWDYYIYSILCSTVIVSLSQSDYLPRYYPSPYYTECLMDFTDFADFLALRFPSKGGKEFTTEQINKINLIPISNL